MNTNISNRQRRFFNQGKTAYIKRLVIIGLIGGVIFGGFIAFMLYKSNSMFSPEAPIFVKMMTGFFIPVLGFGILACIIGWRNWITLNWRIMPEVTRNITVNKSTKQDIEHRFGTPQKQQGSTNSLVFFYENVTDKSTGINLKKAKFEFENGLLKSYTL